MFAPSPGSLLDAGHVSVLHCDARTRRGGRACTQTATQLTHNRQRRRDLVAAKGQIVGQIDLQSLTRRNGDDDWRPTRPAAGFNLRAA